MPNTFEREFQNVIRQRQNNKQKQTIQISLAILLLISGILLLASSRLKLDHAINISNFIITPKDLAPLDLIPEAFRLINPTYDWTLHAWNAVKVGGSWQLVDTTWDDSSSANSYSTDYLMLPPEVMIMSHLPKQRSWQLLQKPKNLKSFEKQPILTPDFFIEDLKIISPTEYQTNTTGTALIQIHHPLNYTRQIRAFFSQKNESKLLLLNLPSINPFTRPEKLDRKVCQSQDSVETVTQVYCQFPQPGDYQVFLFSGDQNSNSSQQNWNPIGQLKFRYY